MKYVLQGAKITNYYGVKEHNDKQPSFEIVETQKEWVDILELENNSLPCNLDLSQTYSPDNFSINLSEDESVDVLFRTFRADLNKTILRTSKIVSEEDNKYAKPEYDKKLEEYYNKMLKDYPKIKEHIELYNIQNAKENIDKIKSEVLKEKDSFDWTTMLISDCNWGSVTYNIPLQITEL